MQETRQNGKTCPWARESKLMLQKWGSREGKKARAPSITGFWTHHKDAGMHSRRGGGHDKTKRKVRVRSNGTLPTGY